MDSFGIVYISQNVEESCEVKKKNKHITGNYITAIVAFVCAIAVSLGIFLVEVQHSIEDNSQVTMKNNVSRQSEHILSILDIHYGFLNGIADKMGKSEELLSDENMEMLASLCEDADLERTALIEADGTAHYDNGTEKNVSQRRYFKEAMHGKETLSDPLESSVDQETRVILGVPVYKNGKVVAVLGGSYNVTTLSRMLFNDIFDGAGYSLIVTRDGEIIAYDGESSYHKITYGDNFFGFYDQKTFLSGSALQNVKADFAVGRDGLIKMRNGADVSSDQYLAYTRLGMNDWMICYVIPVSAAQKSYDFIKKDESIFMIVFSALVVILVVYIICINRKKNEELIKSAQTDGLTGTYNKRSTEEHINEILEKDPAEKGTFVIMDVDRFKEVNDRYGHMTGDKVLSEFGRMLKEHFREGDIIGRIGGDEFVVYMRKTETKEVADIRVRELILKVKQLCFQEMEGQNITISAGVCFAPEHGTCYMDLYKNADRALYETKQEGRDGYRVYKEG